MVVSIERAGDDVVIVVDGQTVRPSHDRNGNMRWVVRGPLIRWHMPAADWDEASFERKVEAVLGVARSALNGFDIDEILESRSKYAGVVNE